MFVSPLGTQVSLLSMSGRESLGRPFVYEVDLVSDSDSLDLGEILAKPAQVLLERLDGTVREFNGLVTEFALVGEEGNSVRYRCVLRPALWFIGQNRKCRIFQNKTVSEIVEDILRERGVTDFVNLIAENHPIWEFVVQYRESDLKFIHRLLEQEGVYYFFTHQNGKHVLTLVDSSASHETTPGFETVPFFPPLPAGLRLQEHIDSWVTKRQIRPDKVTLIDFNFESPLPFTTENAIAALDNDHGDAEVFDFPALAIDKDAAEAQAKLRLEAIQADHEIATGAGPVRGLFAGVKFALSQFPRDDQNKEFIIISAAYEISTAQFTSNDAVDQEPAFRCSFTGLDAKQQFRSPRITPKPVVEGPQTALVVGPEEDEIFTDPFGRVKLKFHWDRDPAADASSSCFVRVAQVWAGDGFGAMHIPRIGQEVIVSFLEGDPDRPIVTGRVYNGFNRPPYPLPDNQTQSGIRSRSSPGGSPSNFNEIRFEDKKGKEDLLIHAERSQTTLVEGSQSISVGGERSLTVNKKDTQTFKDERHIHVTAQDTLVCDALHIDNYNADRQVIVTGLDAENTTGERLVQVVGPSTVNVDGVVSYTSTAQITVELLDQTVTLAIVPDGAILTNTKGAVSMAGPDTVLRGEATVTVKVGENHVVIDGSKIELKGPKIVIDAKDSLELKSQKITVTGTTSVGLDSGGSKVDLKPGTAAMSSTVVDIKGSAQVKLNS